MGAMAKKADRPVVDVHRNPVAILVVPRRRNNRTQRRLGNFADSFQSLCDLTRLPMQLVFIGNVLLAASAAAPKVWTQRLGPIRRGFSQADELRFGTRFLFPHD